MCLFDVVSRAVLSCLKSDKMVHSHRSQREKHLIRSPHPMLLIELCIPRPVSDREVILAPTPPSELSALFVRKSDVGVDGSTKLYDIPKGNCPLLIVVYYCRIVPNDLLLVKGCIKAYGRWIVKGLVADGIDFLLADPLRKEIKAESPFYWKSFTSWTDTDPLRLLEAEFDYDDDSSSLHYCRPVHHGVAV